ncbi:hypothetical protein MIR68_010863 [Amoeboaphelidium protococcarum]|nr:hypothetical protein MIR68_010863 [Amoeboaphelidium protococcarum]
MQTSSDPADSITLAQLKQMVKNIPRKKASQIQFKYAPDNDSDSIDTILNEFFTMADLIDIREGERLSEQNVVCSREFSSQDESRIQSCIEYLLDDCVEKFDFCQILLWWIILGNCSDGIVSKSTLQNACSYVSVDRVQTIVEQLFANNSAQSPKSTYIDVMISIYYLLICFQQQHQQKQESGRDKSFEVQLKFYMVQLGRALKESYDQFPLKKVLLIVRKLLRLSLGQFKDINKTKNIIRQENGLQEFDFDNERRTKLYPYDYQKAVNGMIERYAALDGFQIMQNRDDRLTTVLNHDPFKEFTGRGVQLQSTVTPQQQQQQTPLSPQSSQYGSQSLSAAGNGNENVATPLDPAPVLFTKVPKSIEEALQVQQKNLYIPLSQYQQSQECKLAKSMGISFSDRSMFAEQLSSVPYLMSLRQYGDQSQGKSNLFSCQSPQLSKVNQFFHQNLSLVEECLVSCLKILLSLNGLPNQKNLGAALQKVVQLFKVDIADGQQKSQSAQARNAVEFQRQKEIGAKVVTFIILLILKHSKTVHSCLFEHLSCVLVDSNAMILMLSVLNQNMTTYLLKEEEFDFQKFLLYIRIDFNVDNIDGGNGGSGDTLSLAQPDTDNAGDGDEARDSFDVFGKSAIDKQSAQSAQQIQFCSRNFYTVINILRIMQKLVKNKQVRTGMLIQYKTPLILKKIGKIEQYDLDRMCYKLSKNMVGVLGKKWRQSNMKTVTGIYTHTRPDMKDYWTRDVEGESMTEEMKMKDAIMRNMCKFYLARFTSNQIDPSTVDSSQLYIGN